MLKKLALSWIAILTLALGSSALAADAHEQPGLLDFNATTAIWTLIIFVALLAVLYPTAWKGVLEGLRKREERIRKDITEAEVARARAEATLREYNARLAEAENKVRAMISDAIAQGEKLAADVRAKGQKDAEQAKERAMRDIDAARKQAIAELYEQAAELSTSIAEKILRRSITAEDQQNLVRQSLDQLQTVESK